MTRAILGIAIALAIALILALSMVAGVKPASASERPGALEISPGPRVFLRNLAVSPAYGRFGETNLYALRVAYYPNTWLGYEASAAHNPGESVHALLHSLSAIVRRPFAGRFQPYVAAGYGMILVFPGEALNADPVTKNSLCYGGGLDTFIRDDLSLRCDLRGRTIFGRTAVEGVSETYDYWEATVGLSFYRNLQ
jgi:hypothetical protein